MNFTNSEKLDVLDDNFFNHKNCSSAAHEYAQQYPKRRPPNRKYLKKIIENLRRTGCFDMKREIVKTVVTKEVETDIIAFFYAYPKYSMRKAEHLCEESRFEISSVLKKNKISPVQVHRSAGIAPW